MKDRLLSTLGICRKAGKLVLGFDAVSDAAREQSLALILLSSDLSPKSAKEMAFTAEKFHTPYCSAPFMMDDIRLRLGKRCGIIGVTDPGLAETLKQSCRACEEE